MKKEVIHMQISIQDAVPDDIVAIREIQKQGWLIAYPDVSDLPSGKRIPEIEMVLKV